MFRTLLMQKKGGLPPGVVLYDWLIGDGEAYINTGVTIWRGITVELNIDDSQCSNNVFLFGTRNTSGLLALRADAKTYWVANFFGGIEKNNPNPRTLYKTFYNTSIHKAGFEGWASSNQYDSMSKLTICKYSPFLIFACNLANSTSIDSRIANGAKCSFCRIYDPLENDELLIDLRPCTYNGVPGMWDMVGNQFYGNANTSGNFTVAND